MENILFLGVPILKHIRVTIFFSSCARPGYETVSGTLPQCVLCFAFCQFVKADVCKVPSV